VESLDTETITFSKGDPINSTDNHVFASTVGDTVQIACDTPGFVAISGGGDPKASGAGAGVLTGSFPLIVTGQTGNQVTASIHRQQGLPDLGGLRPGQPARGRRFLDRPGDAGSRHSRRLPA
jgi:hypothetical protein